MSVKVNNLLFQFVTGSIGNGLICIADESTKRIGLELFKNFISNSPNLGGHLLLLDNPVNCFNLDPSTKIKIHQCLGTSIDYPDELEMIQSIPSGRELFIDTLTPFFILHSDQFPGMILELKKKFSRIVALVSLESLSFNGLPIIKDLADCFINVMPNNTNFQAIVNYKKPSSRLGYNLIRVKETFSIVNGKFSYIKNCESRKKESEEQTIEDLPFNLRSADEDNLVQRTNNSLNIKSNEGGKVYYEPGKEDDVDEEDPDEDLLI
ncbi:elongator complex protein 5 [Tetranychus urticae]|uniref:Elongator complex protein 5 n=1 Tax=Tetranychus urticae TaxID=32264 RepID=T1KZ31_TETUR|nr:elongator complex protein 5 [Tetranychus urticae]XP_015792221.1 elongator complex protein 5 [Tetranychus urticae]